MQQYKIGLGCESSEDRVGGILELSAISTQSCVFISSEEDRGSLKSVSGFCDIGEQNEIYSFKSEELLVEGSVELELGVHPVFEEFVLLLKKQVCCLGGLVLCLKLEILHWQYWDFTSCVSLTRRAIRAQFPVRLFFGKSV